MGFDYFAGRYDTISEGQIEQACPDEWSAFKRCVASIGADLEREDILEQLARYSDDADEYDDLDADNMAQLRQALERLTIAFGNATQLGLNLCWVPEGFRGSDVSEELVWNVVGVWTYSQEARDFEDRFGRIKQQWHIDGG